MGYGNYFPSAIYVFKAPNYDRKSHIVVITQEGDFGDRRVDSGHFKSYKMSEHHYLPPHSHFSFFCFH